MFNTFEKKEKNSYKAVYFDGNNHLEIIKFLTEYCYYDIGFMNVDGNKLVLNFNESLNDSHSFNIPNNYYIVFNRISGKVFLEKKQKFEEKYEIVTGNKEKTFREKVIDKIYSEIEMILQEELYIQTDLFNFYTKGKVRGVADDIVNVLEENALKTFYQSFLNIEMKSDDDSFVLENIIPESFISLVLETEVRHMVYQYADFSYFDEIDDIVNILEESRLYEGFTKDLWGTVHEELERYYRDKFMELVK